MMHRLAFVLFVLAASASSSWAAGLTLSIRDGLVSLDAQDVTVQQILTEWARIGRTQILNAERITGGPITLKLEAVPEKQALDIVLRAIPGYMALPRAAQVADASQYERILIMPTTTAVAALRPQQTQMTFPGMQNAASGGANVTQFRPNPGQPLLPGMVDPGDPGDQVDDPAIAAAAAAGLVPVPAYSPGQPAPQGQLFPPGASPAQTTPGAGAPPGTGAPTNPWNAPVGTAQPSLAPPPPATQEPPSFRVRPPQADR
jgi:hypothetical protein